MKRWFTLFAGVLIGLFVGGCCAHSRYAPVAAYKPPAYSVAKHIKSVVKVRVTVVGNGAEASGTAFAISKDQLMTAGHFCVNAHFGQIAGVFKKGIEIISLNNNGELSIKGGVEIETVDEQYDICVLKVEKHGIVPVKFAHDFSKVKVYDAIETVGAPMGFFPVGATGRVIESKSESIYPVFKGSMILDMPGTFGDSGAPVFNEYGKVIGMITAKHGIYDHILMATSIDNIKNYWQQEYGKQFLER